MMSTCTPTTDIISELPDNIVENILISLPLKDAGRTSILSRKWRYKWSKVPQLIFDGTFYKESPENQQLSKDKILLTIYQVLILHWAPIIKFTLSISSLESCKGIDQIMLFLSRKGIEDFTLHMWRGERHKLPSHFFLCQHLKHLNLRYGVFQPPPTFRGFSKLISLELREVTFSADVIGSFISNCPLLEQLTLESFITSDCLEIDAPKLKFLRIVGIFSSLCLKNTALLAVVAVGSHVPIDEEFVKVGNSSNLIEVIGCLPRVEDLCMGYGFFYKLLATCDVPKRLPITLNHLKSLQINKICLRDIYEVSFVLCMIRSSPNLVEITIQFLQLYRRSEADVGPVVKFLEVQDYSDMSLNQLRQVKMQQITGMKPELEFIKLMLAKSPNLKRMLIEPTSGTVLNKGFVILKELARFQRASSEAEIIYMEPKKKQV